MSHATEAIEAIIIAIIEYHFYLLALILRYTSSSALFPFLLSRDAGNRAGDSSLSISPRGHPQ